MRLIPYFVATLFGLLIKAKMVQLQFIPFIAKKDHKDSIPSKLHILKGCSKDWYNNIILTQHNISIGWQIYNCFCFIMWALACLTYAEWWLCFVLRLRLWSLSMGMISKRWKAGLVEEKWSILVVDDADDDVLEDGATTFILYGGWQWYHLWFRLRLYLVVFLAFDVTFLEIAVFEHEVGLNWWDCYIAGSGVEYEIQWQLFNAADNFVFATDIAFEWHFYHHFFRFDDSHFR